MKLGCGYNLWDGEELLERSIESIRKHVDYVVVVYQTTSNFGSLCSPGLESLLDELKAKKLIDETIFYQTKMDWTLQERGDLMSSSANSSEYDGNIMHIGAQFFNEVKKRELGRQAADRNGCTHFMTMDTDEFYLSEQFVAAKKYIEKNSLPATACRMRIIFKEPIYELLPYDNMNAVPFIFEVKKTCPFRLCAKSELVLDPTRKVDGLPIVLLPRTLIEMYHMTFVRKDIRSKLQNVSNRANYEVDVEKFVEQFEDWMPSDGILHPHPNIARLFSSVGTIPNHFNVDLYNQCQYCRTHSHLQRCSVCKWAKYCCEDHQKKHWPTHKLQCTAPKTTDESLD